MVDQIIRPSALPRRTNPVASEIVPVDNGTSVAGSTLAEIVNAGAPVASRSEAEAGMNNTKRMTALTTGQKIEYEIGRSIASKAQGDKADSAIQEIVEGANTTVDNTDPQRPIISSSGNPSAGFKADVVVVDGQADWRVARNYKTVSDLLADDGSGDMGMGYSGSGANVIVSPGDIVIAQGFRFEVAASGATEFDEETAGGVKLALISRPLNVLPDTLTPEQQKQARANIGAISATEAVVRGHIYGLEYSNVSGLTFDMSAGECASAGTTPILMKYAGDTALDLNVAFGTGKGCRFDASVSDGTWYVFLISDGVNTAIGCSKSIDPTSQPNYPTGYVYYQYLSSLIRFPDTGSFSGVKQVGNRFRRVNTVRNLNQTNPGTSAISVNLDVPTGISVIAFGRVNLSANNGGGTRRASISDLGVDAQTPSSSSHTIEFYPNASATATGPEGRSAYWEECTNTSGQVRAQLDASSATTNLTILTQGWFDLLRGQL